MYTKVHKIGNQWFRDDNGTLIGTEVSPGPLLENLKKIYGNKIILSITNGYLVLFYGYIGNKSFYHFCTKKDCMFCTYPDDIKIDFLP